MAKASRKCRVCTHPEREEIHRKCIVEKVSHRAIAKEYFSDIAMTTAAMKISKHLKLHFPIAEVMEKIEDPNSKALTIPSSVPPLSPAEKVIFSQGVRDEVDTVRTVESMMKALMDRANYIQEEWAQIHSKTKCTACGRDETSSNLVRMLAVFREIREQSDSWTKLRNPMGAVQKMAEKTFIQFVEEMTALFVTVLNEKARLVRDATNDFLEGRINQALFAKRISEAVDDFGGARISQSAQEKYQRIMSAALKELKL